MKKLIYSMLALALSAITFTSCEDVPNPFADPNSELQSGIYLKESFASGAGNFSIVTTKGTPWVNNYSTMTATGYNNADKTNTESESYLISPEVDLSAASAAYLQFSYIFRYGNRAGADKVLITTDYTGDPTTTTWDDITGTLTEGSDWATFSKYQHQLDSKYLKSKVRVALYYSATATDSRTWEVKNLYIVGGQVPASGSEVAQGGTADSPYTVAEALAIINSGKASSNEVYVTGIVSKIDDINTGQYGNATYYISDDGGTTTQLEVFRGYALNGDKFTDANKGTLTVGTKVTVCGVLTLYNKTPEFAQGSKIVSFGDNGSTVIPEGGTSNNPFTVAQAISVINSGAPTTEVYVKGIISRLTKFDDKYKSITYYISDDGKAANELQIYSGKGLNGADFAALTDLKVGDEVVVKGIIKDFKGSPEMDKNNVIISRKEAPAAAPEEPAAISVDGADATIDLSTLGLKDKAKLEAPITTGDFTLSFGGAGNTPVFYTATKGFRLYAHNEMTVAHASKNIVKIILQCDSYKGTEYIGNKDYLHANAGSAKVTPTFAAPLVSFAGFNSKNLTIVNDWSEANGGTQLRVQKIYVFYAK